MIRFGKFSKNQIAPCGINCGACRAHLREKNPCAGCNNDPAINHCQNCKIRLCNKRRGSFCDCDEFPCQRLKQLDNRYRQKYGMSEIENLIFIKDNGIEKFLQQESAKRISDRGILCIHDGKIY